MYFNEICVLDITLYHVYTTDPEMERIFYENSTDRQSPIMFEFMVDFKEVLK